MPYDKSVVVPLSADDTFELITQPERLRRWNSIASRVDVRAGGDYRWTIVPGNSAAGTITEIEPGRRLVLGWGWEGSAALPPDASTVTITLEPTQDGTIVRLVHDGLPEDQLAGHSEGWDHYLDRLVVAATDGDAGPDTWHIRASEIDEIKSAEATLAIVERVLRQVSSEDLANSTPCEGFTLTMVLDHLAGSITAIGHAAGAELAPASGSPEVAIADLAQPTLEAWNKRGLDGTVDIGAGDMPATFALGILSIEFLVHAWDFATATGQKLEVNDDLAAYVLELCRRVVKDEHRGPNTFGPEIQAGPDADSLDRLIAFTGRAA